MALNTRTRGWLQAASEDALAQLRLEVAQLRDESEQQQRELAQLRDQLARLGDQLADGRQTAAEMEARMADQTVRAGAETEATREELRALTRRVEEQANREGAQVEDLNALRRRCDEESRIHEEVRLKIAGLAEQWRWESQDLRKALAALAEHTHLSA